MGIEPTSRAWEAPILPLNYARTPLTLSNLPAVLQEFNGLRFMLECRVAFPSAGRCAGGALLREAVLAYRDLRDFIARLEKEGELRRISAEVDPVLEITEITDRVTRAGRPALLFEKPKGFARAAADQHAGQRTPHESGSGSFRSGRGGARAFADFSTCSRRRVCSTNSRCCRSWPNSVRFFRRP